MGRFFNSKVNAFQDVLNSKIYIDKTGLLEYTNSVIDTTSKFICNSRPRRFGKSITADMLTAYYSRSLDTEEIFEKLEVGKTADFRKHLNQYDVIHIDIQWCIEPAGGADQVITFINKNVIEELRETGTGDHGTVKGRKSDGMGSENEQYIIVCKGDCGYRDGLSIMEIK